FLVQSLGQHPAARGPAVLARQRQAYILERIRGDGAVRVADLVRELGVSDMTVRRDLELLHDRGLLEKVHGGATSVPGGALFEPSFTAKSALQQSEKEAIAEAAVALVDPGTAIGISAGTTTYAIARRLVDVVGLTVVTNAVRVADILHDPQRPDQTIILTGGGRTPSDALVGPFAVAALRSGHLALVARKQARRLGFSRDERHHARRPGTGSRRPEGSSIPRPAGTRRTSPWLMSRGNHVVGAWVPPLPRSLLGSMLRSPPLPSPPSCCHSPTGATTRLSTSGSWCRPSERTGRGWVVATHGRRPTSATTVRS